MTLPISDTADALTVEIPDNAEYRVDRGDGWWFYSSNEYGDAMDDANHRSRHAIDDKVRVESRWQSDRTKWQPHGYYLQGGWTGSAS